MSPGTRRVCEGANRAPVGRIPPLLKSLRSRGAAGPSHQSAHGDSDSGSRPSDGGGGPIPGPNAGYLCKNVLTAKIDVLQTDFGLMRRDMDKLHDRLGEAERGVGDSEDSIRDHRASLHTRQVRIKALETRAKDSENRSRRNNLRVVGLPEGAEGQHPVAFTEHMLRTLLPGAVFSPHYAVERAHRMPPVHGSPGAPPPRTFIMLFPDFSVETQRQCRTFDHVKAQLCLKGIKYGMLFPARLRVIDGESTCYFTSLEEASHWMDTLPGPR